MIADTKSDKLSCLAGKKFCAESYGCTFNHADTRKLTEYALAHGGTRTDVDEAEIVIINSCIVVETTERKMYKQIAACVERGQEILLTGCLPVVAEEKILALVPNVVILMPDLIRGCCNRIGAMVAEGTGVVQVGYGCVGNCSYCITKAARGWLQSYSLEDIVDEAQRLVLEGAVEIQLTGQDVSAWGMDGGDLRLPDLLRAINAVEGDFMVRVGMMNPATVLPIVEDLAAALALPKIFRFAHLPVQSGSDKVLADMRRGYTGDAFREVVAVLRSRVPDLRLSTDIIAGFPTETDDEFAATTSLLDDTRPHKVNITRFSVREGTSAASLYDLPDRIKKDRSRLLTLQVNACYDEINEHHIGRVCEVLVTEKKKPGSVVARDRSYNNIVIQGDFLIGDRMLVTITGHHRHYLLAVPCDGSSDGEGPVD